MEPTIEPVPGTPNLLLGAYDAAAVGYAADEYFVSGTATSHADDSRADYVTRIVVLTPTDRDRFSGTVVVEWLNVSGGIDAPAVWFMAHREIVRAGHAYVAVSAQRVGVEGGASLGMDMSLKTQNPARYGALSHPGDAYSYDLYSQIGRLVRTRSSELVAGMTPKNVVAVGESQSALFLTTYVNAVDPSAATYDGFLVHSRFGPAAPLDGASIFDGAGEPVAVPFADELRVPVLTVITETDLVGAMRAGYYLARKPDGDRLRAWEIPGTAHADNYTIKVGFIDTGSTPLADLVAAYAPTTSLMGQELAQCINFAPQHHYVLQAALAGLVDWTTTGTPPRSATPIDVTAGDTPQLVLDEHGLATGGIRTPWVDVPVARTSGLGAADSVMAMLFGSGELFDADALRRLYPGGVTDYVERFTRALDATIAAGFLLGSDRAEILALAAAAYPGD